MSRGRVELRKGEYRIPGMSRALRHAPEDYGITLNSDGSVLLQELAEAFNVRIDDVLNVVETDAKNRYQLIEGDNDSLFIRAVHGHTISVNFEMNIVENPGTVFHGTKVRFLENILAQGLNRGERNHVHMSTNVNTAIQVANRHKGETAILIIDGTALVNSGSKIYLTASEIYLTDTVAPEFITEIVYV